jgi:uncharacterized protein (TIGR03435 family)
MISWSGRAVRSSWLRLAEFAYRLSRELKRPVFDKTGIAGAFDLKLHYSPDPDAGTAPSLFIAVQETLGLKLESVKEAVEILVVDHIEKRATEN